MAPSSSTGWEDLGMIRASPYRLGIMQLLLNGEMTPREISRRLSISLAQVTRTLRELEGRELIECLSPKLRKGRLYTTTDKGKEVMSKNKEDTKNGPQGGN